MNIAYTLKIICDLCFYFAFANTISSLFGGDPVLAALPVFAVSVYFCVILVPKGKARYFPLAAMLAFLLIIPVTLVNAIVLAPAVVYVIISIRMLEPFSESFSYSGVFFLFLKVYIPFLIIMLVAGALSHLEAASIFFAFLFLILSVLLMRMLRHTAETLAQTRFKIINLVQVFLVVILGGVLGSRNFLSFLGSAFKFFYFNVLSPILWLLTNAFLYILWPLMSLLGLITLSEHEGQEIENFSPAEVLGEQLNENPPVGSEIIKAILILAAIAAAVFLLYKFFRRVLSFDKNVQEASPTNNARAAIPSAQPPKRGRSGENQIRAVYRKFIIVCQKHGIKKLSNMTTADYEWCTKARFDSTDSAAEFRSIYINVRYGDKTADKDETRKMKEHFASFRKNI